MTISADHIKFALSRRFGGRSWMHSTEIEVLKLTGPDSQIYRRFDFVAANVCAGHSFTVIGVEIKVTRQDFLNEQRDATKFATLYAMSHAAYYASPKGLLKKTELPDGAGLLELQTDGRLRESVRPRQNEQADVTLVLAGMLRRSYAPTMREALTAIHSELGLPPRQINGMQDPKWWVNRIRLLRLKGRL